MMTLIKQYHDSFKQKITRSLKEKNMRKSIVGLSNLFDGFSRKVIDISVLQYWLDFFLAHSLREILNDC
jgi:hypothetical protein